MEIHGFSVSGYRCLADIAEVPIRNPTILAGVNDGGKSTALNALGFLLGGPSPIDSDRTISRPDDADPPGGLDNGRFAEVRVTGRFALSTEEQDALGLPPELLLRRVVRNGEVRYQHMTQACEDPDLRDLENRSLEELKALATSRDLDVTGHQGHRKTYLEPLGNLVKTLPVVDAWLAPSQAILQQLPEFIEFRDDDPEAVIRQTLMGVYRSILQDPNITRRLKAAEQLIRDQLIEEASRLRDHIKMRCPDLPNISIDPTVSFRDQFPSVRIEAGQTESEMVGLGAAGSGRRQRVALATWEFAQDVLQVRISAARPTVICYDEPDTHLDYGHQRNLAELIREQSQHEGVKVLVATHALNLIDRVPIENVVHLAHTSGRTTVELLLRTDHNKIDEFLINVATAMGLRTSVLLHERCFVAVEGSTEAQVFPVLFRLATGLPLQSAGLTLIAANGNAGAVELARHLAEKQRPVAVVVDEDTFTSRSTKKRFREAALKAAGIDPAIVHRVGARELEDLFTDSQWAAAANRLWPRKDGRKWKKDDIATARTADKFSDALIRMIKTGAPGSAPREKPSYLLGLVQRLRKPSDVPQQLREVFDALVETAR
ncbi:MAG: AAA family ATPase [Acidimicrobiia bacterium]